MARSTIDYQLTFFQTPIDELEFDLYSRDQMPKLLLGIQEVYKDQKAMVKTLKLIQKDLEIHLNEFLKRIASLSAWEDFDQSVARASLARNLHEIGVFIKKQKISQLKKAT